MSRFLSKASESLLPYTPGEQPQGRKFIKLNTNECPYPPSPKVAEAILAGYEENSSKIMPLELANLRLYSDPEERVLIEAIADRSYQLCGVCRQLPPCLHPGVQKNGLRPWLRCRRR